MSKRRVTHTEVPYHQYGSATLHPLPHVIALITLNTIRGEGTTLGIPYPHVIALITLNTIKGGGTTLGILYKYLCKLCIEVLSFKRVGVRALSVSGDYTFSS